MTIVNLGDLVSDQGIRCRKFSTNVPNLYVYFVHSFFNSSNEILEKQTLADSHTFGEESIHIVFSKFENNKFSQLKEYNYNGLESKYVLNIENLLSFN